MPGRRARYPPDSGALEGVGGVALPIPPWLSHADHAALTLEIALAPQETAAMEARLGITAAGRATLDADCRGRVTAIPEMREAWHRAYAGAFAFLGARRPASM